MERSVKQEKKEGPKSLAPKKNVSFSVSDVARLYDYLVRFRDLSIHYCCHSQTGGPDTDSSNWALSLAGYEFPPLNYFTCTQPFLAMPSSLGAKHRKAIHDICLDIPGIYHSSIGPKKSRHSEDGESHTERTLLLSIFVDGLEYHKDWIGSSDYDNVSFPLLRCKSWYYLNHGSRILQTHSLWSSNMSSYNSRNLYWARHYFYTYTHVTSRKYIQDETNLGLKAIQTLLQQPETCFREQFNYPIHFNPMDQDNLSQIPPPSISTIDPCVPSPWLVDTDTFLLVDTIDKMNTCIHELNSPQVNQLAFDLEAYNPSKLGQVTCLLQLSTNVGKDYVIDVLAPGVWDAVTRLKPIFANPTIVKVGHNIASLDISSLHRDFGILVVNAFDTQVAAETLHLKGHFGLAKLCEYYGLSSSVQYQSLKYDHQMKDWRIRPLTPSMVLYGVCDVHYLIPLRRLLIRDLCTLEEEKEETIDLIESTHLQGFQSTLQRQESMTSVKTAEGYYTPQEVEILPSPVSLEGSGIHPSHIQSNVRLRTVITKSLQRCLLVWKAESETLDKNETFIHLFTNSRRLPTPYTWTEASMALCQVLMEWRDSISQQQGLNPCLVLPLDLIVMMAYRKPRSIDELRQLSYMLPEFLATKSNMSLLHELLEINSLALDQDQPSSFSTGSYKEYLKRKTKRMEIPFHLNILRWTLISGVTLSWLSTLVRKR